MENQNEQTPANTEGDVILPDGWTGEGDFFEWAGRAETVDELANALEAPTSVGTEETEDAPATGEETVETEESKTEDKDKPATQTPEEPKSSTIRFDANINHKQQSVEINQSDLPELYEKAYAADKFRNKLNAKTAEQEEAEVVAQLLGYSTVKEMLAAAKKSFEDSEVKRLVDEKVHPDIAKDTVARKVKEIEEKAAKNRKSAPADQDNGPTKSGERDFRPEVAQLLKDYPELHGKTLPKEVVDAALSGQSLVVAYTRYAQKQMKAEQDRLQKENSILKQNAETAKRAPVRGVAKGGATKEGITDPFLAGFNAY